MSNSPLWPESLPLLLLLLSLRHLLRRHVTVATSNPADFYMQAQGLSSAMTSSLCKAVTRNTRPQKSGHRRRASSSAHTEVIVADEMPYLLPHFPSGWAVNQAILLEEERLVVIPSGYDWDETCMQMDKVLESLTPGSHVPESKIAKSNVG